MTAPPDFSTLPSFSEPSCLVYVYTFAESTVPQESRAMPLSTLRKPLKFSMTMTTCLPDASRDAQSEVFSTEVAGASWSRNRPPLPSKLRKARKAQKAAVSRCG